MTTNQIQKRIQRTANKAPLVSLILEELTRDHKKHGNCGCFYCVRKWDYVEKKLVYRKFKNRMCMYGWDFDRLYTVERYFLDAKERWRKIK